MDESNEPAAFDFDTLSDEEMGEVAETIGVELLPLEDAAAAEGEEGAEEADGEADAEGGDEAAGDEEGAQDEAAGADSEPSPAAGSPLDPAVMAAAAASCVSEAQGYADKLAQLAEQVTQSDPKAGKKIAALAKKAEGIAGDVQKLADKAAAAAEKDKLGDAAELAREASTTCADARALFDEARKLLDGADLPEDEPAEEKPKEPAAPTRSAIEDWANSVL